MGVGQAYMCRRSGLLSWRPSLRKPCEAVTLRAPMRFCERWLAIHSDGRQVQLEWCSGAILKSGIHTDSSLTVLCLHQRGPIKIRGASRYLPDKITEFLGTSLARDKDPIRKVFFLFFKRRRLTRPPRRRPRRAAGGKTAGKDRRR